MTRMTKLHYEVADCLASAHIADLMPIRCTRLDANGYYHLRAANGDTKTVASGSAQTAWGNAAWPKRGKWAVLWFRCIDSARR